MPTRKLAIEKSKKAQPSQLQKALEFAAAGYRVLPLKQGTRIPKGVRDWQTKATSDPAIIKKWWARLPNANVGLATGGTFFVIDVDVKDGKPGKASLQRLIDDHQLPQTYTVRTPSGGLHLYYQHPFPAPVLAPDQKSSADTPTQPPHRKIKNVVNWAVPGGDTYPGIDIRSEGGQVVAPGMYVDDYPKAPYTVISDVPRAELPDSIIIQLPLHTERQHVKSTAAQKSGSPQANGAVHTEPPQRDKRKAPAGVGGTSEASVVGRGGDFVGIPDYALDSRVGDGTPAGLVTDDPVSEYSTIPDRIPAGGRDDTLFRFMCSWRERGYPLAHAEILARELHSRLEQPPGDEITLSDVVAKLQRTYKTYVPSEEDEAALQSVVPSQPIIPGVGTDQTDHPPTEAGNPVSDYADIIEVPPEGTLDTVQAALDRFVLCIEGNLIIDTLCHPAYSQIRMDAFKSAYGNIRLKTSDRENAKWKPLPEIWLKHKNRQTVDDYGYRPNGPKVYTHLGTTFYNKWAPSEVADLLGTLVENDPDIPVLDTFWTHLDFLFGADRAERDAFWMWLAYSVRYPERQLDHGVLIVSHPGVGKSWFYKLLQRLAGVFDVNTAGNNELNSDFNGWVSGCSFVVIHELMTGSKRQMMQQLLSLITEERLLINEKHKQPRMRDIYANFLCFSNHGNAAALGTLDRRFFVYQSAAVKASVGYYKKLFGWLDTDGPLHLLQYIHAMDFSQFNPGEAPMTTAAKRSMAYASMDLVEQAITDAIEDRVGPFTTDITSAELVEKYLESRMDLNRQDRHMIRTTLTNLSPPLKQGRYRLKGDQKQHRLRAIRNGATWAAADVLSVLAEFQGSLDASSTPVTQLEIVS